MKIGRLKNDKKLNWGISFQQDLQVWSPLAKEFAVWCFKQTKLGTEGGSIRDLEYKGFWYRKQLMTHWNIILYTKTINIPYWIKITKK